jgi:hypothetical protein
MRAQAVAIAATVDVIGMSHRQVEKGDDGMELLLPKQILLAK